MDEPLPSSPILVRLLAEHPWTLAAPLLLLGAVMAYMGARNERAKLILWGVGALLTAAAVLATAALWRSPGEEAAEAVAELVRRAEAADPAGMAERFSADATIHYGSPQAVGFDLGEILRAAESLKGRHKIEGNTVTELDFATIDSDHAAVVLGCRTTTASSYGPVPTRWALELTRRPDGRWLIERLVFLRVGNQAASRNII